MNVNGTRMGRDGNRYGNGYGYEEDVNRDEDEGEDEDENGNEDAGGERTRTERMAEEKEFGNPTRDNKDGVEDARAK